jgi:hypothetical protein
MVDEEEQPEEGLDQAAQMQALMKMMGMQGR